MIYFLTTGLLSFGYGLWIFLHPQEIAQKNRDYIESGKESYFEERRSWKAYNNAPSTDREIVKRRGFREMMLGIFGIILAVIFYAVGDFS